MTLTRKDRLLGCLVGAAYGDALGAPTENRTREQIYEKWGYVDRLYAPPDDVFARGNQAGQVTDDFSMAYVAVTKILEHEGVINCGVAKEALIEWSENERFFEQFVGPTSRKFINRLKGETCENQTAAFEPVNDNLRASNGAAMKIGPISLFAGGDLEKAIKITEIICMPTHGNWISMSAAGAVAASVNSALRGCDLYNVFQDGLWGAARGEETGRSLGVPIAGPSVRKRMQLAISMGEISRSLGEGMDRMREFFDCSGMAADSVPVAFGLIAAARGDAKKAVEAAANIGNDTDTIATIVGAVAGTYRGWEVFDRENVRRIDEANGYELEKIAVRIEQCRASVTGGDVR